jgi:hypothetical protein
MKEGQSKSDNELLQEISSKLSELTAIIGIAGKDKNEQVKYLIQFGFSNSEISKLTGLPIGTVSSIRNSLNKKKKKNLP